MNKDKNKIIKLYGVTLADEGCRTESYGHGATKIMVDGKECYVQYVDYFIEHLISLIKQQRLQEEFINKLKENAT